MYYDNNLERGDFVKCTLDRDINKCPFYRSEKFECDNPQKCSFQENMQKNSEGYVREPRWYEQYYKGKE